MVFVFSVILRSSLRRAICMVWGELLCCLAAIGNPLGDSWEVLRDPWGLPLCVLRAPWESFGGPFGGSGAPLTDFVDLSLTLETIGKQYVFVCFWQQEINLGFLHGGFRTR